MFDAGKASAGRAPSPASCEHDYKLDKELESWVCAKCGKLFDLMVQTTRHECGADCDRHGDISAIG